MKNLIIVILYFIAVLSIACCKQETLQKKPDAQPVGKSVVQNHVTPSISAKTVQPTITTTSQPPVPAAKTILDPDSKVKWIAVSDLNTQGPKQKKKVMVDLYTDWCGWCKKMDKNTFEHPEIATKLNKKFLPVKFNAEMQEPIDFKGKKYTYQGQGRRGFNTLAYEMAKGKMSYPTIAFLDENLDLINAFPGYLDASQFESLLAYIEGNHYKTKDFAAFQKTYTPKIKPTGIK